MRSLVSKKFAGLLSLVLFSQLVFAVNEFPSILLTPASLPVSCKDGELRVDSADSFKLKSCASNAWSVVGTVLPAFTTTRVLFGDGTNIPVTDAGLTYDSGTDTLTTTAFVGALTGNASTATALAANPNDCSASQFANAIAANGNLTCAQAAFSDISGTAGVTQGGTGFSSYTTGDLIAASNSTTLTKIGVGTAGQVLKMVSGFPNWAAGTGGFFNLLASSNPGFESGTGSWTESGGTKAAATSGNILDETASLTWDSGSASQTLSSTSVTIPNGMKGRPGWAQCKILTPSGTATHKIQVYDGTNVISERTVTSSTLPVFSGTGFNWPSSGSLTLRLISVASDEPLIALDSCGIYDAEELKLFGTVSITDSTAYTPTATHSSGGITNATITGSWRQVGDKLEGRVRVSFTGTPANFTRLNLSLPAGKTIDTTKLLGSSVDAENLGRCTILDTGTAVYFGDVIYNSTTTVALAPASTSNAGRILDMSQAVPFSFGNGDSISCEYKVPITNVAPQAVRADWINWFVDANIAGANPSLGTSDVTAYAPIENGSLTLTNNTSSAANILTAQIGCSSTNAPSGTTCSAGNESVAVAFTVPGDAAQYVEACFDITHELVTGASGFIITTFQVVQTATNAQTILQEGKGRVSSGLVIASANVDHPQKVCGTFTLSPGQNMLRLMYEQDVNATVTNNIVVADGGANYGQHDIHVTVRPLGFAVPVPYFVNQTKYETATSNNATPAGGTQWIQFTTNSVALTQGQWMCSGWVNATAVGSVTYAQSRILWAAANGANSGTDPALLSTLSGLTVNAGFADQFIVPAFNGDNASFAAPTLRLTLTQSQTIYLNFKFVGTTASNARVQVYPYCERLSP